MSVNIERALTIEGWMEPHDLRWLAHQASRRKMIVEVGVWQGRSTRVLADNTDGIVYAVDHGRGSTEHADQLSNKPNDYLYKLFAANLADHLATRKVRPIWIDSLRAAKMLSQHGHIFDMVFIDASHDAASFKADVAAWKPLVMPGGILCGHDAGHPPIAAALDEILPDRPPNECSMWLVNL